MVSLRRSGLLAALLSLAFLPAAARPLAAQTPAPRSFSTCIASLPNVQAPPSGVLQAAGGIGIVPIPLASLDDAQAAYGFPLLLPTAIPDGYQLSRIVYEHAETLGFDVLTVCYLTSDGHYLEVRQGTPLPTTLGIYDQIPDGQKGTTTVQGQEAYWTVGALIGTARPGDGPPGNFTWQPGPLHLTWSTGIPVPDQAPSFVRSSNAANNGNEWLPVPQYVGYELESDSLGLDDLVAIANSVQPYPLDGGP